jgi:hypothetical protein
MICLAKNNSIFNQKESPPIKVKKKRINILKESIMAWQIILEKGPSPP